MLSWKFQTNINDLCSTYLIHTTVSAEIELLFTILFKSYKIKVFKIYDLNDQDPLEFVSVMSIAITELSEYQASLPPHPLLRLLLHVPLVFAF